jgi:alpha-L-rhamnosidase
MLGHIQQWFYGDLAGIQRDPNATGFERIVIRPQLVDDLTWVKAHHDAVSGRIVSAWERDDRTVTMQVTIPVNTTATVYVPTANVSSITESGQPLDATPHVRLIGTEGDCAVLAVVSGSYRFASQLP